MIFIIFPGSATFLENSGMPANPPIGISFLLKIISLSTILDPVGACHLRVDGRFNTARIYFKLKFHIQKLNAFNKSRIIFCIIANTNLEKHETNTFSSGSRNGNPLRRK